MEPCNYFKRDIINRYLSEHNHYKEQYDILDKFIRSHNLRCVDCDILLYNNTYKIISNRCNPCGFKTIVKFWYDHKNKFIFIREYSETIIFLSIIIIGITLITYIFTTF